MTPNDMRSLAGTIREHDARAGIIVEIAAEICERLDQLLERTPAKPAAAIIRDPDGRPIEVR